MPQVKSGYPRPREGSLPGWGWGDQPRLLQALWRMMFPWVSGQGEAGGGPSGLLEAHGVEEPYRRSLKSTSGMSMPDNCICIGYVLVAFAYLAIFEKFCLRLPGQLHQTWPHQRNLRLASLDCLLARPSISRDHCLCGCPPLPRRCLTPR